MAKINAEHLAQCLQRARKQQPMSCIELCRRTGFNREYIRNIQEGYCEKPAATYALAQVFGMSKREFMGLA